MEKPKGVSHTGTGCDVFAKDSQAQFIHLIQKRMLSKVGV